MDSELTSLEYNRMIRVMDTWCHQHRRPVMSISVILSITGVENHGTPVIVDTRRYMAARLKYGF
jgi:hypothetical protein